MLLACIARQLLGIARLPTSDLDTIPKSSYHQNRASQSPRIQAREGEPSMTELTNPGVIMALCYAAAGLTIYLRALVLA